MRPHIRKFVEICLAEIKTVGPYVEIGARRHPSQEKIANLRALVPKDIFIGCDLESGSGVDRIEDLEQLTFSDGEVGTFILCDTLEHVRPLQKAMCELERSLNPISGVLVATCTMLFPVHGFPNDYWRFTPEGFRELAQGFEWVATFYGGDFNMPHTVAFVASRHPPDDISLKRLIASASVLPSVPHYTDKKSTSMISNLVELLWKSNSIIKRSPSFGEMGKLSTDRWILVKGDWVNILVVDPKNASHLELKIAGRVIQIVNRADWNILVDTDENLEFSTAFMFSPDIILTAQLAQIEVYLVHEDGQEEMTARSELGVVVPEQGVSNGLVLHYVDDRSLLKK